MHTLSPAYGRDYKSAASAIADYKAGKDFRLEPSGQYCSIRDFSGPVKIRYAKLTRATIYNPKAK